jgi:PAS domain S-box-containing protein
MGQRDEVPIVDTPETDRLRVLRKSGEGQTEPEALRLALHHAVADLGGLGGMVHMCGPGGGRRMRLVATNGLPREFFQAWEYVDEKDGNACARALSQPVVWVPGSPEGGGSRALSGVLPAGAGMASASLPSEAGPLGVLSVVGVPSGQLSAAQESFLKAVARWAADRLSHPLPAPREMSPAWWGEERFDESRFQQALKTVRLGAWDWEIGSSEMIWDEPLIRLFGLDPETFDRRVETWMGMVHPDDLPRVMSAIEDALRTRSDFSAEYRVYRPDGTTGWVEARGRHVVDEQGEITRMIGTIWDTTETRIAMDAAGRALRHMTDGFLAVGSAWRIEFLNVRAEQLLGSQSGLIGRTLWDLPAVQEAGLETRCRRAAAGGNPVGFQVRWPADGRWYHIRLVPVPDGLTMYFTDITEKRVRDAEREAVDRADAERAAHIGELTAALAKALTTQDVVTAVAQRVLPLFGAAGLVMAFIEDGRARIVGAVGYRRSFLDYLGEVMLSPGAPATETLGSGVPAFMASPEEYLAAYPNLAELVATGQKEAWAFLPLIASGRPIGICVLSWDRPRRLVGEERTLLIALSGLVAQALERARLYDAEHSLAQELQRGLLPRVLPSLSSVTTAAAYLPAGTGAQVGGDWYDVIPLSADRVALVIGDVMGHGLPEAITMGRLRTAVRTLVGLEQPPDELLAHLNDLVSDLGDDFYATCLYVVYDPVGHSCIMARAGHPPPAIVHPDGSVHFPELAPNPPLGAATPPIETTELNVPEGSLLVLYTDGLIESAHRDSDSGMSELGRALASSPDRKLSGGRESETRDLNRLCESLMATLVSTHEPADDDTAILVARTHVVAPENVASWSLPEKAIAASVAREHIRRQLGEWSLDDLATVTELVASELVANVVRHARGPVRLRLMRSRTLICEVSDGSLTTPRVRRARDTDEGGRGLQLVAALCQRWGTRYTADGKSIWTEQPLPAEALTH